MKPGLQNLKTSFFAKKPAGKLTIHVRALLGKVHNLLAKPRMANAQDIGCSSNVSNSYKNEKLIYPAATRNKEPILQVLKRLIIWDCDRIEEASPLFLEVSSGSGQHVAHFAPHFPGVKFQPSEYDESLLFSISHYAENCPTKNVMKPILLDICKNLSNYGFVKNSINYIYNANMIHISPYKCTEGLFKNAGIYLKEDALMITYGPYSKDGVLEPKSNIQFDASLRARNSSWGVRDVTDLAKLAEINNLCLLDIIEMPSNNKIIVWKKSKSKYE